MTEMPDLLVTLLSALIMATPPTIVGLITLRQGRANRKILDEVHTLTNSNLTRVMADLALANDRIEALQNLFKKDGD